MQPTFIPTWSVWTAVHDWKRKPGSESSEFPSSDARASGHWTMSQMEPERIFCVIYGPSRHASSSRVNVERCYTRITVRPDPRTREMKAQ